MTGGIFSKGVAHAERSEASGRVKLNVVPASSFAVTQIRPPCASTIEREIERPMPIPDSFVVKNGSKTSDGSLMPTPKSRTSTRRWLPSRRDLTTSDLGRAMSTAIASVALWTRLMSVC